MEMAFDTVLTGGRIIDPAQGIDKVADLAIKDGKIAEIGEGLASRTADVVDTTGLLVIPGMVDLHCHAYGFLGFAYPDRIGIHQGVTTFVDAGGTGLRTYGEFDALLRHDTITDLYASPYLDPIGITGLEDREEESGVRGIKNILVNQWLDLVEQYRDSIRFLKIGAFAPKGPGNISLGKGMAEVLDLPLYIHIGDFLTDPDPAQVVTTKVFQTAQAGDVVTHLYHGNPGNILEGEGKVLAEVKAAERRGVLFDIGFGGFNFSFDVAEKAYAQDVVPHMISSDLQQVNVTGPTYSLANVMSIFNLLGLTLPEIIERVTINPARALGLEDRAGSLIVGRAADVSVLDLEDGEFNFADCCGKSRTGRQRFSPAMVYKGGKAYEIDMEFAKEERNWHMQISEEAIPAAAGRLNESQKAFLLELGVGLQAIRWDSTVQITTDVIEKLHERFYEAQALSGISLKDALLGLYACFTEEPCSYQAGLFILFIERSLFFNRLSEVTEQRRLKIA